MFTMEISCFTSHLPKQLPKLKDEGAAAGRVSALCTRKMPSMSSPFCSCIRRSFGSCYLQKNVSVSSCAEHGRKASSWFGFEEIQMSNQNSKKTRLSTAIIELPPLETELKEEEDEAQVEQVLHMVGGTGEISYAKNSKIQSKGIVKAKPFVEEAVKEVYKTLTPEKFVAVDLACSSGPNTFLVISEINNTIDKISRQLGIGSPEIQMFLNDLPGNDFNNVFQSLIKYGKQVREEENFVPFYVAGLPGSFYTRLFPSKSVHFFHSSYGQMWLSKVPSGVNGKSASQLRNKILYMEQFKEDFSTFLKLRSKELVSGGRMVLTISGRREIPKYKDMAYIWGLLSVALNDMIFEGILEERERNATNFPFHTPTMEEIKYIIQKEGSFYLDQFQAFELSWDPFEDGTNNVVSDYAVRGKAVSNYIRAAAEPMLNCHFDRETIDVLFSRYAKIIAEHLKEKPKWVSFILDLKLKG